MKRLSLLCLLLIPTLFYAQKSDSLIVHYFDKKWNDASPSQYHFKRPIINKPYTLSDTRVVYPYKMVNNKNRIYYEGYVSDLDSIEYTFINKE